MEEFSKYCRFILTANYAFRIIPALQSRCQSLELKSPMKMVARRMLEILKQEGVAVNMDRDKEKITKLIADTYPDIRATINKLQRNVINSELIFFEDADTQWAGVLLKMIKTKSFTEIRENVIQNESNFAGDYPNLMKDLLNTVYADSSLSDLQKQKTICLISEHLYRSVFCLDQEINFSHMIAQLKDIV